MFNRGEPERLLPVSEDFILNDKYKAADKFIVTANGNGMINAGILNGDYLVFADTNEAPNGAIIILELDGELKCRRYFKEGKRVRLRREDTQTPDIYMQASKCQVLGVLVTVIRAVEV